MPPRKAHLLPAEPSNAFEVPAYFYKSRQLAQALQAYLHALEAPQYLSLQKHQLDCAVRKRSYASKKHPFICRF